MISGTPHKVNHRPHPAFTDEVARDLRRRAKIVRSNDTVYAPTEFGVIRLNCFGFLTLVDRNWPQVYSVEIPLEKVPPKAKLWAWYASQSQEQQRGQHQDLPR